MTQIRETVLGPASLIDLALPTGVDAAAVLAFQMQEGLTGQEAIQLAATVIGEANQQLNADWGSLVYFTEMNYAMYRIDNNSSREQTRRAAEFSAPKGRRAETIGHMLPMWDYDDAVEWSRQYLERASRQKVTFDLEAVRDAWIDRVDYDIIRRMFVNTEDAIGSAGYSVGWAIGTGTSVNYIPPEYRGNKFTSSHTHFKRVNAALSSTNALSTLETLAGELSHHGHLDRKIALVSASDLDTYFAMDATKFVTKMPVEFTLVGGASSVLVQQGQGVTGLPGEVFGYVNSKYGLIELRSHARVPTGYLGVFKSYGVNNSRNPVAVRIEPAKGFGLTVDPIISRSLSPALDHVEFHASHGVGVNDRTVGAVGYIASGASTYANPTIS